MRFLNDWISDSLLRALGWTLVHSFWQLILIAALLWLVLKLAHKTKPAIKYGFSIVALLLSFLVVLGTFLYQLDLEKPTEAGLASVDVEFLFNESSTVQPSETIRSSVQDFTFWIDQNLALLVNVWFLGVLLFLFKFVNSLSEIRTLRKTSKSLPDFQIQKIVYRLAEKMGVKPEVQLRITESGISPLTFGTLKPVILFPAGLLFQLSPIQLEAIIAHELAHVKRNDYLVNLLLSGLEVIFFYHPCYWWMNNSLKELRENAADDLVMQAGIEPKNLATSLAEILNFAKQNPPELALAAGKKRNPTLQRIKRMLGYPSQNYPQNPIISLPMLLTLLLSAGLMASAQQDKPKTQDPIMPEELQATGAEYYVLDTIRTNEASKPNQSNRLPKEENVMVISDKGYTYRITGDTLISGSDTLILKGDAKVKLDQLRAFDWSDMPEIEFPEPPVPTMDFEIPPIPDFDMEFPMEMTAFAMEPMFPVPPFDFSFDMDVPVPPMMFFGDTTKMSKADREKWAKDLEERSKDWAKIAEERAAAWSKNAEEWAKHREEWAAKWEEGSAEREAKIEAWKKEFEPKMKEFEQKMKEWQAAHEPKMKEFELKMKEWEATQKPKMEEFQQRMEEWQKKHQAKLEEFQKQIQKELSKENNN